MSLSSGGIGISARVPDLPTADAAASAMPLPAPSPATFELRRRHQLLAIRRGSRAFGRSLEALAHGDAAIALTEIQQAAAGRGRDLASVQLFTGLSLMQLDRMPEATSSLGSVVASDVPLPDRLMRQHLTRRHARRCIITPNVTAHTGMDRGGVALLLAELLQHTGQTKRSTDLLETYGARTHSGSPGPVSRRPLPHGRRLGGRGAGDGSLRDQRRRPHAAHPHPSSAGLSASAARSSRRSPRSGRRCGSRTATRHLLNEARYERALVYEAEGKRALARKDLERIHDHEPELPRCRGAAAGGAARPVRLRPGAASHRAPV